MLNNFGDTNRAQNGHEPSSTQSSVYPSQPMPNVIGSSLHPAVSVLPTRNYTSQPQLNEYYSSCFYPSKIFPSQRSLCHNYKRGLPNDYHADKRQYFCLNSCCQPYSSSYSMNTATMPTPIRFPFSQMSQPNSIAENLPNSSSQDQLIHSQAGTQQCQPVDVHYLPSQTSSNSIFNQRVNTSINAREPPPAVGSHYGASNYLHHAYYSARPSLPVSPEYYERTPNKNQSSKMNSMKQQTSVIKNSNDFSYSHKNNLRPSNMMHITPMNYLYNRRHSNESLPPDCLPPCSQVNYPPNNQYSAVMAPHAHRNTIMETPVFPRSAYNTPMIPPLSEPDPKLQDSIEHGKKNSSSEPPLNIDVRQFLATWDDNDDEPETASSVNESENSVCSAANKSSQSNANVNASSSDENVANPNAVRKECPNLTSEEENSVLFKILKPSGHKTVLDPELFNVNPEHCVYSQIPQCKTESPLDTKTTSPVSVQPFMKHCPINSDPQYESDMFVSFYNDRSKCSEPSFEVSEKVLNPHEKVTNSSCPYTPPLHPLKNRSVSMQGDAQKSYFDLEQNVIKNRKTFSSSSRSSKPTSRNRSPVSTLDYDPEKYIQPIIINKSDYTNPVKSDNEALFKHSSKTGVTKKSSETVPMKEKNSTLIPPNIQFSDKPLKSASPAAYSESIPSFHHNPMPYNKKTLMPYRISTNNQLNNANYEYPMMSVISNNCNYVKYDCSSPNFISEDQKFDNTCSVNINLNITSDKSPHVFLNSLNTANPNHISCNKPLDNPSRLHHDVGRLSESSVCNQNDTNQDQKKLKNVSEDTSSDISKPSLIVRNEKTSPSIAPPLSNNSDKELKCSSYNSSIPEIFQIQSMIDNDKNASSIGEMKYYLKNSSKSVNYQETSCVSADLNVTPQPNMYPNYNENINNAQQDETKSGLSQLYLSSEVSTSRSPTLLTNVCIDSNSDKNFVGSEVNSSKLRMFQASSPVKDKCTSDENYIQLSVKNKEEGRFSPSTVLPKLSDDSACANPKVNDKPHSDLTLSMDSKNSKEEVYENRLFSSIIATSQPFTRKNLNSCSLEKSASKSDQIDIISGDVDLNKKQDPSNNFPIPTNYVKENVLSSSPDSLQISSSETCRGSSSLSPEDLNSVLTCSSKSMHSSVNSVITTSGVGFVKNKVETCESNQNYPESFGIKQDSKKMDNSVNSVESVAKVSSHLDAKAGCIPESSKMNEISEDNKKEKMYEGSDQVKIEALIHGKCESFKVINDGLINASSCFQVKTGVEAEKQQCSENKVLSLSPVLHFPDDGKSINANNSPKNPVSVNSSDEKNNEKKPMPVNDMASLLIINDCADSKVNQSTEKAKKIKSKTRSMSNEFSNFDIFNDNGSFFSDVTCSETPPKLHPSRNGNSSSVIERSSISECFSVNNSISNSPRIANKIKNDELILTKTENHTDFEILVQNEMNKFNFESDILNISSLEVEVETSQFFNEQSILHNSGKTTKALDLDQSESSGCSIWKEPKKLNNTTSILVEKKSNLSDSEITCENSSNQVKSDQSVRESSSEKSKSHSTSGTSPENQNSFEPFFVHSDDKAKSSCENQTVSLNSEGMCEDKSLNIHSNVIACSESLSEKNSSDCKSPFLSIPVQTIAKINKCRKDSPKDDVEIPGESRFLPTDVCNQPVVENISNQVSILEKISSDNVLSKSSSKTLSMDDFIQLDFSPKEKSSSNTHSTFSEASDENRNSVRSNTSQCNIPSVITINITSDRTGDSLTDLVRKNVPEKLAPTSSLYFSSKVSKNRESSKKKKRKKSKKHSSDQLQKLLISKIKLSETDPKSEMQAERNDVEESAFSIKSKLCEISSDNQFQMCKTSTDLDNPPGSNFQENPTHSKSASRTISKNSQVFCRSPLDDKISPDLNERITHSPMDCFDSSSLTSPKLSASKSVVSEIGVKNADPLFSSVSMIESPLSHSLFSQGKKQSYSKKSKIRKKCVKSSKASKRKNLLPNFCLEDNHDNDEFLDLISTRICNNLEADDTILEGHEALSSRRKLLSHNDPFIFRKEKGSPTNGSESISLELNKSTGDSDIYPDIDCVDSDSQSGKRIETIPFTSSYDTVPDAVYESLNTVSVETSSPVLAPVDLISDDSMSSSDKSEVKVLESKDSYHSSNQETKSETVCNQSEICPTLVDLTDSDISVNNSENLPDIRSKAFSENDHSTFTSDSSKPKVQLDNKSSASVRTSLSLDNLETLDQFPENLNSVFLMKETSSTKIVRKEDGLKSPNMSAVSNFPESPDIETPILSKSILNNSGISKYKDPLEISDVCSSQAVTNTSTDSVEPLFVSNLTNLERRSKFKRLKKKKKKKNKSKKNNLMNIHSPSEKTIWYKGDKEKLKEYKDDKWSTLDTTEDLAAVKSSNVDLISTFVPVMSNSEKNIKDFLSLEKLKCVEDREVEDHLNDVSNNLKELSQLGNVSSDIGYHSNLPSPCPFLPTNVSVNSENQQMPIMLNSLEKSLKFISLNQNCKSTNECSSLKQTSPFSFSQVTSDENEKSNSKKICRSKAKKSLSCFSNLEEIHMNLESCKNTSKVEDSVQNISSSPDLSNFYADSPFDRQENINFEDFHALFDQTLERFSKLKEQEKGKNNAEKSTASSSKVSAKGQSSENETGHSLKSNSQKKASSCSKSSFETHKSCEKKCKKNSITSKVSDETDPQYKSCSEESNLNRKNSPKRKFCGDADRSSNESYQFTACGRNKNEFKVQSSKKLEEYHKNDSVFLEDYQNLQNSKSSPENNNFVFETYHNAETSSQSRKKTKTTGDVVNSRIMEDIQTNQGNENIVINDQLIDEINVGSKKLSPTKKDNISRLNEDSLVNLLESRSKSLNSTKVCSEVNNNLEKSWYSQENEKNKILKLKKKIKDSSRSPFNSKDRTVESLEKRSSKKNNNFDKYVQNSKKVSSKKGKSDAKTLSSQKVKEMSSAEDTVTCQIFCDAGKNIHREDHALKQNDQILSICHEEKRASCEISSFNVNSTEKSTFENSKTKQNLKVEVDVAAESKNNLENNVCVIKHQNPKTALEANAEKCFGSSKNFTEDGKSVYPSERIRLKNDSGPKSVSFKFSIADNPSKSYFQDRKFVKKGNVEIHSEETIKSIFSDEKIVLSSCPSYKKHQELKKDEGNLKTNPENLTNKSFFSPKVVIKSTNTPGDISVGCRKENASPESEKLVFDAENEIHKQSLNDKQNIESQVTPLKANEETKSVCQKGAKKKNDDIVINEDSFSQNLINIKTCPKNEGNILKSTQQSKETVTKLERTSLKVIKKAPTSEKHGNKSIAIELEDSLKKKSPNKKIENIIDRDKSSNNDFSTKNSASSNLNTHKPIAVNEDCFEKNSHNKKNVSKENTDALVMLESLEKNFVSIKHLNNKEVMSKRDVIQSSSFPKKNKNLMRENNSLDTNKKSEKRLQNQNTSTSKVSNCDDVSSSKESFSSNKAKIKSGSSTESDECKKYSETASKVKKYHEVCTTKENSAADQLGTCPKMKCIEDKHIQKKSAIHTPEKVSSQVSDNLELLKNVFGTNKTKYKSSSLQTPCDYSFRSCRKPQNLIDNSIYFAENYRIIDVSKIPLPTHSSKGKEKANNKICTDDFNVINCKLQPIRDNYVFPISGKGNFKAQNQNVQPEKRKEDVEDDMPTLSPTKESIARSPDSREMPILLREGVSSPKTASVSKITSASSSPKLDLNFKNDKKIEAVKPSVKESKYKVKSDRVKVLDTNQVLKKGNALNTDHDKKNECQNLNCENFSNFVSEVSKISIITSKNICEVSEVQASSRNKVPRIELDNEIIPTEVVSSSRKPEKEITKPEVKVITVPNVIDLKPSNVDEISNEVCAEEITMVEDTVISNKVRNKEISLVERNVVSNEVNTEDVTLIDDNVKSNQVCSNEKTVVEDENIASILKSNGEDELKANGTKSSTKFDIFAVKSGESEECNASSVAQFTKAHDCIKSGIESSKESKKTPSDTCSENFQPVSPTDNIDPSLTTNEAKLELSHPENSGKMMNQISLTNYESQINSIIHAERNVTPENDTNLSERKDSTSVSYDVPVLMAEPHEKNSNCDVSFASNTLSDIEKSSLLNEMAKDVIRNEALQGSSFDEICKNHLAEQVEVMDALNLDVCDDRMNVKEDIINRGVLNDDAMEVDNPTCTLTERKLASSCIISSEKVVSATIPGLESSSVVLKSLTPVPPVDNFELESRELSCTKVDDKFVLTSEKLISQPNVTLKLNNDSNFTGDLDSSYSKTDLEEVCELKSNAKGLKRKPVSYTDDNCKRRKSLPNLIPLKKSLGMNENKKSNSVSLPEGSQMMILKRTIENSKTIPDNVSEGQRTNISTTSVKSSANSGVSPAIKSVSNFDSSVFNQDVSNAVEENHATDKSKDKVHSLKRSNSMDLIISKFPKKIRYSKSLSDVSHDSVNFLNSFKKKLKKKSKSLESSLNSTTGLRSNKPTHFSKSLNDIQEKSCSVDLGVSFNELDGSDSFFKCYSFLKDNMQFIANPSNCFENDVLSPTETNKMKNFVQNQDAFYDKRSINRESFDQNLKFSQKSETGFSKDCSLNEASFCSTLDNDEPIIAPCSSTGSDVDTRMVCEKNSKNVDDNDKNNLKVRLPWNRIFSLKKRRRKNVPNSKEIQLGPAKIEVRLNSNDNSGAWKVIKNSSIASSSDSNCSLSSPIGIKVNRLILQRHSAPICDARENSDSSIPGTDSVANKSNLTLLKNGSTEKPDIPTVIIKKNGTKCYKSYFKFTNKPQPYVRLIREKYIDSLGEKLKLEQNVVKTAVSKNEPGPFSSRSNIQKHDKDSKCGKKKATSQSCENLPSLVSCPSSQEEVARKQKNSFKSKKRHKSINETLPPVSTRSKGRLNRISSCPTLEKMPNKVSLSDRVTAKNSKLGKSSGMDTASKKEMSEDFTIKQFVKIGSLKETSSKDTQISRKQQKFESSSSRSTSDKCHSQDKLSCDDINIKSSTDGKVASVKLCDKNLVLEKSDSESLAENKSMNKVSKLKKTPVVNLISQKSTTEELSPDNKIGENSTVEVSKLPITNTSNMTKDSLIDSASSHGERVVESEPPSSNISMECLNLDKKLHSDEGVIIKASAAEKSSTGSVISKKLNCESAIIEKITCDSFVPIGENTVSAFTETQVNENSPLEKLNTPETVNFKEVKTQNSDFKDSESTKVEKDVKKSNLENCTTEELALKNSMMKNLTLQESETENQSSMELPSMRKQKSRIMISGKSMPVNPSGGILTKDEKPNLDNLTATKFAPRNSVSHNSIQQELAIECPSSSELPSGGRQQLEIPISDKPVLLSPLVETSTKSKKPKENFASEKSVLKNTATKNITRQELEEECPSPNEFSSVSSVIEKQQSAMLTSGKSVLVNTSVDPLTKSEKPNLKSPTTEKLILRNTFSENLTQQKLDVGCSPSNECSIEHLSTDELRLEMQNSNKSMLVIPSVDTIIKFKESKCDSFTAKESISKSYGMKNLIQGELEVECLSSSKPPIEYPSMGKDKSEQLTSDKFVLPNLPVKVPTVANLTSQSFVSEKLSAHILTSENEKNQLPEVLKLDTSILLIDSEANNSSPSDTASCLKTTKAFEISKIDKTDLKSDIGRSKEIFDNQIPETSLNLNEIESGHNFCVNKLTAERLIESECTKETESVFDSKNLEEERSSDVPEFAHNKPLSLINASSPLSKSLDSEGERFHKQLDSNCNICCKFSFKTENSQKPARKPVHCSKCFLVFKSQVEGDLHNSTFHKNHSEIWDCVLCQKMFKSKPSFEFHLKTRLHRLLEVTQKQTIHSLFRHFTGKECPHLDPVSLEELSLLSSPAYSVLKRSSNTRSQPTPLQVALEGESMSSESIVSNDD